MDILVLPGDGIGPEIVGASATTGFMSVDRDKDRLLTPLVYMTEIERSVSLGALNRIDFRNLPADGEAGGVEDVEMTLDGAILGRMGSDARLGLLLNQAPAKPSRVRQGYGGQAGSRRAPRHPRCGTVIMTGTTQYRSQSPSR